jgi:hypothetical protein
LLVVFKTQIKTMKIYLLLLTLLGTASVRAQNSFALNDYGTGIKIAASGTEPQSNQLLTFFQVPDGRIAYLSQGDTVYLEKPREDASTNEGSFSNIFFKSQPDGSYLSTNSEGLASWGKGDAADNRFLQIGSLASQANNLLTCYNASGFANQPSSGYSVSISSAAQASWIKNDTLLSQAQTGIPLTGQTINCLNCFTVSSVQPASIMNPTGSRSTISQQFEVDSLIAYNPTNSGTLNAWLRAGITDSAQGMTSLSIWTASQAFPNNRNGAISINVGDGTLFGISTTDSVKGIVGWLGNSQGTLTLSAQNVFTRANLVDSGYITTTRFFVSDQPGTTLSLPAGFQAAVSSADRYGTGILLTNASADPNANTTLTLQTGSYANKLYTVSAFSADPARPPGSFVMEGAGHNLTFNVSDGEEGQPAVISFEINSVVSARLDAVHGFSVYQRPSRLLNVTTQEMKALQNPEQGWEVFNTDFQTKCTYTRYGWKADKTYLVR